MPGHWIHQCPTNGDANLDVIRMKTAYGVPQNRLVHVENGVLVAPTGESSELVADDDAFDKMMGFLTDDEKTKGGAAALPAPGDGANGGEEAKDALPRLATRRGGTRIGPSRAPARKDGRKTEEKGGGRRRAGAFRPDAPLGGAAAARGAAAGVDNVVGDGHGDAQHAERGDGHDEHAGDGHDEHEHDGRHGDGHGDGHGDARDGHGHGHARDGHGHGDGDEHGHGHGRRRIR